MSKIINKINNSSNIISFENNQTVTFTVGLNISTNKFKISLNNGTNNDMLIIDNSGNIMLQPINSNKLIINNSGISTNVQVKGSSNQDVLFVDATNNNIGINTITPSFSYKLDVNGNARMISCECTSDIRYKTNIKDINNALLLINQLSGKYFKWKFDEFPNKEFTDKEQIGFIAQDVEKIIPLIVNTDNDGYKSIIYDKLVALLVEGIKEQQEMINKQQEMINKQQEMINKQQAIINKQQNDIDNIINILNKNNIK